MFKRRNMRIVEYIRTFRANRRTWRAYKRHILDTWAKPGFNSITYRGNPMVPEIIQPEFSTKVTADENTPITEEILENLMDAVREEGTDVRIAKPTIAPDMRAAKMNAINKKLGAM